jgi:PHD/YefM family antitoxin component YafN of YafNO toxin-antitoxin module
MSEGRKRLFELRKSVVENHDQVVFSHKDGNVIMVSLDEWNQLTELLKTLQNPQLIRKLMNESEMDMEQHFAEVEEYLSE